MNLRLCLAGLLCLIFAVHAYPRDRPAPSPSRYSFTFEIDTASLPKGVSVRKIANGQTTRFFIKNTSDVPLIINQRHQANRLVSGNKLVSGKVFHYFPNGVPMEGKQHLKGWQAPFGEITETLLVFSEPKKIYEGRKPGLGRKLPPAEPYAVPATFDGKPFKIKGKVSYQLNKAYDAYYQAKNKGDERK